MAVVAVAVKQEDRFWVAEQHRLKGELLSLKGSEVTEIEACFRQAIEIAQRQDAKSLELRARTSLARLLQRDGRSAEARAQLAETYDWFTEGFDTPDLQAARVVVEELS